MSVDSSNQSIRRHTMSLDKDTILIAFAAFLSSIVSARIAAAGMINSSAIECFFKFSHLYTSYDARREELDICVAAFNFS